MVFWLSVTQIIVKKWCFTNLQEIVGNHVNHDMAD